MSNLFEIFNPNAAHWRRQRDLDKVAVVPTRNGAQGPLRIDLDKGTITLPESKQQAGSTSDEGTDPAQPPHEQKWDEQSPDEQKRDEQNQTQQTD